MNKFIKAGLVSLIGITSAFYIHTHIENRPLKLTIEVPIAIATVAGIAYFCTEGQKRPQEVSVQRYQLRRQIEGISPKKYHFAPSRTYLSNREDRKR